MPQHPHLLTCSTLTEEDILSASNHFLISVMLLQFNHTPQLFLLCLLILAFGPRSCVGWTPAGCKKCCCEKYYVWSTKAWTSSPLLSSPLLSSPLLSSSLRAKFVLRQRLTVSSTSATSCGGTGVTAVLQTRSNIEQHWDVSANFNKQ